MSSTALKCLFALFYLIPATRILIPTETASCGYDTCSLGTLGAGRGLLDPEGSL